MITFTRSQGGIYLTEAAAGDPATARVGFLFQDAGRTDPTVQLSAESWQDPASLDGYFAFFVPSADRDWSAFTEAVRAQFQAVGSAQLGWFAEDGSAVTNVAFVQVSRGGQPPFVGQSFTLVFNNVTLTVQSSVFSRAAIAFDDASNAFQVQNIPPNGVTLSARAPDQTQQTFQSSSAFLALPMDDGVDPHAGSVTADFPLSVTGLAAFEAGFMYFGQGTAGLLAALNYPVFRAADGGDGPLGTQAWLDVLQPLADTRSYLAFTDPALGSYFTSGSGTTLGLTTTAGDDVAALSRLVFANRPVNATTDTNNYYLTPAGTFGLTAANGTGAAGGNGNGNGDGIRADLLCGVTGTEFLNVATSGTAAASLVFVPGQAAYQLPEAVRVDGAPRFLDDAGGNVTTSWVQAVSTDGLYVSQPQDSPLYQQDGDSVAMLGGAAPESGLEVYLLDFLPLPSWRASADGAPAAAAPTAAPAVPMVPFSGLQFSQAAQAEPFRAMDVAALNPTRRYAFTTAPAPTGGGLRAAAATGDLTYAMTPQGLLAGLDSANVWTTTQLAISHPADDDAASIVLQLTEMGSQIRQTLQQNQIFAVISSLTDPATGDPLFAFAGSDQTIEIAGWPFSLSPAGTPSSDENATPPILILKFFTGRSIADLAGDLAQWSQPDVFNGARRDGQPTFTAEMAQAYVLSTIQAACEAVYGAGKCPDGTPTGKPNTDSLFYNFYQVVTDPNFTGILALNCNMQLNALPPAIRAVTGGMTVPGDDGPVSNIDAFRVHHVGVSINDTDPQSTTPTLAQSSLFGLVDYEKPADAGGSTSGNGVSVTLDYGFEVEYLRALFTNSELSSFSCQINLTINNLFGTDVSKDEGDGAAADDNVVVITGSYQAHSTSGDAASSGEGVYSFVTQQAFDFTFAENPYLKSISLTKIQFSFEQESAAQGVGDGGQTSTLQASFGIWGSLVFNEFKVLDIFAFEKLVFNDLGISVQFDLTTFPPPKSPVTANLKLAFSPGNLRLDLASSPPREGSTSLLSLLPFKLNSFLYNQFPDQQTVEDLRYYSLSAVPLDPGFKLVDRFNYGLLFDLDLGTLGALVGNLEAFKFSFLVGWLTEDTDGGIAFGVQLPEANGRLEINIQGVLQLVIQQFVLQYQTAEGEKDPMLVLALHKSYIQILGTRMPPAPLLFDFALFAPIGDAARIGWITALSAEAENGGDAAALPAGGEGGAVALRDGADGGNGAEGDSKVFELTYLGLGQRTGPDPTSPPTTFAEFLKFMNGDFWDAFNTKAYDKVYHPDGKWLALADFTLLGIVEIGFVFYDVTPFYSLTLNVKDLFQFEITYTKISDSIGLFYASFALPDSLRTFQVGAASLTLPSIAVSVYTNGNWKLDVGFPAGDDWSRSFRVQAQAGPVPVTGSGGFYIASLSSATSSIFQGDYPSIVAFGFAARLGVGKDFVSGPLKAGVSVTFFGIIEGAAGYLASGSANIFESPDALMLKGQFGIIGELYGSIDFVIVQASVNVRLQASIGIVLTMERTIPGSGSILLYIEASVSVSVTVKIRLVFFSIKISFSFKASFRFQWELLPAGSQSTLLMEAGAMAARRTRNRMLLTAAAAPLPLLPGFTPDLSLWFLPEGTVVFPAASGTGVPYLAVSLGVAYDDAPSGQPTYAEFQPFEKVTAQLTTWAVGEALGESGATFTVTQDQIGALDQTPDLLVGAITYDALVQQLAVFTVTTVTVPGSGDERGEASASLFPMPPFLQLQTTGREDGNGAAADLSYVFSDKNNVPTAYIDEVTAYFNQLFVNQTQGGGAPTATLALEDGTVPLVQEIFLNYFTGLVRGAVHAMLQTMENGDVDSAPIDTVIRSAVGEAQFAALAGQMSSSFRGGSRLPYTSGLTVPGGDALDTTNPLFALLWQEFPVGSLGESGKYTVALLNPSGQRWIDTSGASWTVDAAWLQPLQAAKASDVTRPSEPVQLPFTDVGPQAFAFENAVPWEQPGGTTASLRVFPSALVQLQASESPAAIAVSVQSRAGGAPYLPGGTPLDPSAFSWATQITLTAAQVPGGAPGQPPLADVFSLSGASQQDQALLEQVLDAISGGVEVTLQVLYQEAAGSTGLISQTVNGSDVFVLRTNTTTVSVPPTGLEVRALAAVEPSGVPVGATVDEQAGFLQIVQQASITNAPGYFLRYVDAAGDSIPAMLFAKGPAPLTILIGFPGAAPSEVLPYYNAIVLDAPEAGLVYYAETTDARLDTQYSAVAAGSIGAVLTRDDSVMMMEPVAELQVAAGTPAGTRHHPADVVQALLRRGVTDHAEINRLLADGGATAADLNALYSLLTYQVTATDGFVASNLSAPVQPQQPDEESSAADGVGTSEGGDTRSYRVYVPLYNLAKANQAPSTRPPNRYASIGSPVAVEFYQNDAFGNQMPSALPFGATNFYFDPILPVEEWLGVVTAYDFHDAGAGGYRVYLTPTASAFAGMSDEQAAAALQTYYTIYDQLTGPGVSMVLETNLALDDGGALARVTLTEAQMADVVDMVGEIVAYLEAPGGGFSVPPVVLSATASGPGTLPPVFEIAVFLGIERDPALISPLLKAGSVVTFPSAQNRYSSIVPTVGASEDDGTASVQLSEFAAEFVAAFPDAVLSVGLGGATQSQTQNPPAVSAAAAQRNALRAEGVPGDGSGTGQASVQSLWAVQASLVTIEVGIGAGTGPFYISPTPLDNTLNSATVPLPPLPPLPPEQTPASWPAQQLFTDVDLDVVNADFFGAVDNFLTAASAAQAFELARAAYTTVASGRRTLADLYSTREVDWLFPQDAPFTGTAEALDEGREAFGQQMRAALSTAYAVDTVVQYAVAWTKPLPAGVGDLYSLFGSVRPVVEPGTDPADAARGFTLSSAEVAVQESGTGLLTFLFGVADVRDTASVSLALEYNVTHVQHFLAPEGSVPDDEARPSIWLQLVDPYPDGPPTVGPAGTETEIPLVLRQYPTPPTLISQQGVQGASAPGDNPLTAAAAWHLLYQYQAQLTEHDRLATEVTYNTELSASSGGRPDLANRRLGGAGQFTLFQSLARFSATYRVLAPVLTDLSTDPTIWAGVAAAFASLVEEVATNTTWNPTGQALFALARDITDPYALTDQPADVGRLITLTWPKQESSFAGAALSVVAIGPDGLPYPDQVSGTVPNGITDQYTPDPELVNDWVTHRIEVDNLNVLAAENALAGVQVERNLIEIVVDGTTWTVRGEFVYRTPMVRATQPVTPFVDNDEPIDVAKLPNQGIGTGCPAPGGTVPPGTTGLCQRIYTLMYDLLADAPTVSTLVQARRTVGQADAAPRRVKVACGFAYPVRSASGVTSANPISPLVPVVLARSFVIDGTQTDQIGDFSSVFATAVAEWAQGAGVALGPSALAGAQFVFDITLYAELSGLNTPVLRLRNLQLNLTDVAIS